MTPRTRSVFGWMVLALIGACGGETAGPNQDSGHRLIGAPGDPAVAAVARELYEPRAEDFSLDIPTFPEC